MGTLWQFFGFPDPEAPAPESVKKSKKRKPKAEEPPGQQLTLVSPDDAETITEATPAKLEPESEPVKEVRDIPPPVRRSASVPQGWTGPLTPDGEAFHDLSNYSAKPTDFPDRALRYVVPDQMHRLPIRQIQDRVMRGEGAPSPIYEGEDSVIARILDGKKALYKVPLPKKNEEKKAILETYTKEYSAEYQAQALIDIAKKLNKKIQNLSQIKKIDIYTSHHTHYVIGTGANDPQKMDPNASRETLDHSIMYIFAVALEDASWHHVNSYKKSRANKKSTIKIWRSIKTHEDKKWTRKYHDPNPKNKSFGAKVVVTLNNNKKIIEQLDKADAHPYGLRPFVRKNYINKFLTLTKNILSKKESDRFLKTVQNLTKLKSGQLNKLNIEIKSSNLKKNNKKGIF